MAKRMSNRERIQRQAMEVAAKEREKEEKKEEKKAASKTAKKPRTKVSAAASKKETASAKRLRVVWTVFDERLKEVASFPYAEKAAADEKADALTKKSGKTHVVRQNKVAMEG